MKRNNVGLIDVSTLGKLEIRGADAAEFLERVYTFRYSKQPIGRSRYVLMTDNAGAIVDDGVALVVDAGDPAALVLFPEMNERLDVAEITTACWSLLGVDPDAMMCASSRMAVKHKGAARPAIVPCTLLPYDSQFDLGPTLAAAAAPVRLNHPHCARFCVLGGGSCNA